MAKASKPGMSVTPKHITQARLYQANYKTAHGHLIPSVIGLAQVMHIPRNRLTALIACEPDDMPLITPAQRELKLELQEILEEIKDMQHFELLQGGLGGTLNSNIVKLALGKHGYSDKQDTTVGNPDGTPLDTKWTVTFVEANGKPDA